MKKTLLILWIIVYSASPVFCKDGIDSLKCLKQINEKEFIVKLDYYCRIISTNKSDTVFNDSDFVEIVILMNTINAFNKYLTFKNYTDTFGLINQELNNALDFVRIPGDGSVCKKYNLFTDGYFRASSIYWIIDWEYPPGFPDIVDNCECMFPPCD